MSGSSKIMGRNQWGCKNGHVDRDPQSTHEGAQGESASKTAVAHPIPRIGTERAFDERGCHSAPDQPSENDGQKMCRRSEEFGSTFFFNINRRVLYTAFLHRLLLALGAASGRLASAAISTRARKGNETRVRQNDCAAKNRQSTIDTWAKIIKKQHRRAHAPEAVLQLTRNRLQVLHPAAALRAATHGLRAPVVCEQRTRERHMIS